MRRPRGSDELGSNNRHEAELVRIIIVFFDVNTLKWTENGESVQGASSSHVCFALPYDLRKFYYIYMVEQGQLYGKDSSLNLILGKISPT